MLKKFMQACFARPRFESVLVFIMDKYRHFSPAFTFFKIRSKFFPLGRFARSRFVILLFLFPDIPVNFFISDFIFFRKPSNFLQNRENLFQIFFKIVSELNI